MQNVRKFKENLKRTDKIKGEILKKKNEKNKNFLTENFSPTSMWTFLQQKYYKKNKNSNIESQSNEMYIMFTLWNTVRSVASMKTMKTSQSPQFARRLSMYWIRLTKNSSWIFEQ